MLLVTMASNESSIHEHKMSFTPLADTRNHRLLLEEGEDSGSYERRIIRRAILELLLAINKSSVEKVYTS